MASTARLGSLDRLRRRLETLEKSWRLADAAEAPQSALLGAAPLEARAGALNEARAGDWRDGPAALGFALALAGARARASGKAIVFLALAHEARRGGSLYGRSLSAYGVTLSSLVLAFARDVKQLLWAAEEAARSGDVAAVVIEGPGAHPLLDLTASRRLQLAAASSGAAAILVRTMNEPEPNAAEIRWRVAPALSGPRAYDARASGNPRWRVEIERCRKGGRGAFLAEFRHEDQRLISLTSLPLFDSLAPRLADRPPEATSAGGRRWADGSL